MGNSIFLKVLPDICNHRFNDFLAITEIQLHRNNMGFNNKIPFVASRGAETSHISSLAGNLKLLNKTCAFGRLKVNYNFSTKADNKLRYFDLSFISPPAQFLLNRRSSKDCGYYNSY